MRVIFTLGLASLLLGCPPNDPGYLAKDTALSPGDTPSMTGTGSATGTGTGTGTGTDTDTDTDTSISTGTGTGTGAATGGPTPTPVELVEEGVQTCADPGLRDVAVFDRYELGYSGNEWIGLQGSGLAVGDLDGDGDDEIMRTTPDGPLQHFVREGDDWTEIDTFHAFDTSRGADLSVADYDGDGDLDLFVGRFGAANLLLRNDDGAWVDVAPALGLERRPYLTLDSSWTDMNLDGYLDLFEGNYAELPPRDDASPDPSKLYLGSGGGWFQDISDILPYQVQASYLFMSGWYDTNGDGYPELISITDFFYVQQSAILLNDKGMDLTVDEFNNFQGGFNGMGLGVADDNGDEIPDFVQSSTGRLSIMLSLPTPSNPTGATWLENAPVRGLVPERTFRGHTFGWGVEWVDADNDGDMDIPMMWGYWDDFPSTAPFEDPTHAHDALWIADEEHHLTDLSAEWGFDDPHKSRGLVMADIDENGWIDAVKSTLNGPTIVLEQRCGDRRWLGVRLSNEATPNRFGIGARIKVVTTSGSQIRWIQSGSSSMFSGGPPKAIFGLDEDTVIERLEVLWPDQTLTVFEDIAADQYVTVVRR